MEEVIEITMDVNKDVWDKLKQLSNGLEDGALLHFIFRIGEYILEAIKKKSVFIEMDGETAMQAAVDFGDLLDQYCLDDLDDFIKKAKPDDFN